MSKPKCHNCQYASKSFKIASTTHHCCLNEVNHPLEEMKSGKQSAWDALVEWYYTCDQHKYKKDE